MLCKNPGFILSVSSSLPSAKMFLDSTNLDVDSTAYEHRAQSELYPLIRRDEKGQQ